MKVGYYPGCKLYGSAKEYDTSARLVFESLGCELEEMKDWNCCGAFEAVSANHLLAISLSARNLALAKEIHQTLVAGCNICLNNLIKANKELKEDQKLKKKVEEIIEDEVGNINIKHFLEIIIEEIGLEKVKSKVKNPLHGVKIAPYYGCVLLRPSKIVQFENPENPQSLERLIEALGGESVFYPYRTKCCDGSSESELLMDGRSLTLQMSRKVLLAAKDSGAQCIAVICPMCHRALETTQLKRTLNIPILYFTQIMGLAFGFNPRDMGLQKHLISCKNLVKALVSQER